MGVGREEVDSYPFFILISEGWGNYLESNVVKENHIGSADNEIQTDRQTHIWISCYFYIKIDSLSPGSAYLSEYVLHNKKKSRNIKIGQIKINIIFLRSFIIF